MYSLSDVVKRSIDLIVLMPLDADDTILGALKIVRSRILTESRGQLTENREHWRRHLSWARPTR